MTVGTLLKFNLRCYRRHPLLSLLCLMGICLGVGIVVAVELINNSALASFSSSVDFLSGKATHSVVSAYGRIDERDFITVWKLPGIKAATPVVETMATTLETGDDPIRFVGIDPFLDGDFRGLAPPGRGEESLVAFLAGETPSVHLSAKLAKQYDLKPGMTLTVLTAGIEKRLRIARILPPAGPAGAGDNLAVVDISSAQDIFGRKGYLDRIDIIAEDDAEVILRDLPTGLRLTDADERKSTLTAMLYSFQLNLAAMSLLALFVGIFLIYNFSMFSVLSRREDMSLLLTLGADRRDLVGAFLAESFLLGAGGSLLGIAFGYFTAWFSIDRVASTISDLYFFVDVKGVRLTPLIALSGLGVGFAATVVGTGLPALEVAITPPILGMKRQTIEDRAHGLKGLLLGIGAIVLAGAFAAGWASRFSVFWGFASAFGATLAFALFTPSILSPFSHYMGIWIRKLLRSTPGFLGARTIRASLSRTSIAVAALAVALSMTIGVDTMIHSFRRSVDVWLEGTLQGDLYISAATTKWDHPLPASLIDMLMQDPRIEGVERYATHDVYVNGRPVRLRVVDGRVLKDHSRFAFLEGSGESWDALQKGGVFISESLGYRFRFGLGSTVGLSTPDGVRHFPVVAVVREYSSDRGIIQIDRLVYEKIWRDRRVQSVALFLKPGESAEEVRRSIVKAFPGLERTIVSNSRMREDILVIFDKTFAPTATLKGVSLLVALLGIATALTAILMERSREMTVLGYLGLTAGELGRMNVYQALVMGLAAFLISVLCGLLLTYIIIYAINYRSFGWSIDVFVNPWVFVKAFGLTIAACLIASAYPTYRLTRSPTGPALEEE